MTRVPRHLRRIAAERLAQLYSSDNHCMRCGAKMEKCAIYCDDCFAVFDELRGRDKRLVKRILNRMKEAEGCPCGATHRKLVWHHTDPDTKLFTVGNACSKFSWREILAELDKCVVLCSDCHGKAHKALRAAR